MKKVSKDVDILLTKKRVFTDNNGKIVEREFKAVIQNVTDQEVLYLHEVISQKYGNTFTIDLVKHIPEEHFIYFRGTFKLPTYRGKGTIYVDPDSYEIIFDNLARLLAREEEAKMKLLIKPD